jgi:hypothetical protein
LPFTGDEITVKAIDDQEKILAIGSNQRPFPENKENP